MSIFNLYSKQQPGQPLESSVYQHDNFPEQLRTQLLHIIDDLLSHGYRIMGQDVLYPIIHKTLCREYGLQRLPYNASYGRGDREAVLDFLLNEPEVNKCLDVLQVTFAILVQDQLDEQRGMPGFTYLVPYAANLIDEAIYECNQRFKEQQVGFQFVGGQIVRIDSEFTHQELTLPALKLLAQDFLKCANEEFFTALDHHRNGRNKECLNECLKAFESTMKAICHKRKWQYPVFMDSHLTGLRTTLESGVPTARNKLGGHGQGVTPIKVSSEFAAYVLNLTASNIQFLAASERAQS